MTAEACAGHPFCPGEPDLTRVCTKLHAKGLRNPFRFHLRPDGSLAMGDVGWGPEEEIDLLDGGGADLGWPCHEGALQTSGYRDLPACKAEYAKSPQTHRPPDYSYDHISGKGGAVVGGPDHPGAPYPGQYRGASSSATTRRACCVPRPQRRRGSRRTPLRERLDGHRSGALADRGPDLRRSRRLLSGHRLPQADRLLGTGGGHLGRPNQRRRPTRGRFRRPGIHGAGRRDPQLQLGLRRRLAGEHLGGDVSHLRAGRLRCAADRHRWRRSDRLGHRADLVRQHRPDCPDSCSHPGHPVSRRPDDRIERQRRGRPGRAAARCAARVANQHGSPRARSPRQPLRSRSELRGADRPRR